MPLGQPKATLLLQTPEVLLEIRLPQSKQPVPVSAVKEVRVGKRLCWPYFVIPVVLLESEGGMDENEEIAPAVADAP